jgi:hypothetical protein
MLICVALTTTMLMLVSSAQFSALTGATTVTTPAASFARLVITTPATPAQREKVLALLEHALEIKGGLAVHRGQLATADAPAWIDANLAAFSDALAGRPVAPTCAGVVAAALKTCGVGATVSA